MVQDFSPVLSPPLLFATDGSPGALRAQKMVCAIAQILRSDSLEPNTPILTVLSVNPRPRRRFGPGRKAEKPVSATVTRVNQQAEESATLTQTTAVTGSTLATAAHLSDLVQHDLPAGFPIALEVREGRPTVEILNYAHTIQAGLIAVGHRGQGGVRELLLGSVSTAIARYAPCSVLVARSPADDTEAQFTHILVVVEADSVSHCAIAAAQQLVNLGVQQVTLLYIHAPLNANHLLGPFTAHTPNWQLEQSLQAAQREKGEDHLQQAKAAFDDTTLIVHTVSKTGDPGPTICQMAEEQAIDLILLGSDPTRRSLLSHLHVRRQTESSPQIQSVTQRAILRNTRLSVTEDYTIHYAPCPVLLCRSAHS